MFDVDIQDGVPPLKLPYNVTGKWRSGFWRIFTLTSSRVDNPFSAAQKFLETNELSLNYIDEVVKFIEKNTAGVNIGTGGEDYVDPYTGDKIIISLFLLFPCFNILLGASRYRSSAASVPAANPASSYVDPYTGASRYSGAPQATAPAADQNTYMDPFTGASRYSGAPQPTVPPPAPTILPVVSHPASLFASNTSFGYSEQIYHI